MIFVIDEERRESNRDIERNPSDVSVQMEVVADPTYGHELKAQLSMWDAATFMYNEAGAWVSALNTLSIPFFNGGFSAAIYGVLALTPVIFCYVGCLSEMLSAYPTAGGQYHFVAMLAPKKYARSLSFVCGYMTLFLWIAATTSCHLSFSQQIFQMAMYYDAGVGDFSRWATVGGAFGLLIFSFLASTFYVPIVTYLTRFQLYYTMALFVALNILMLVKTPDKNSAKMVFGTVTVDSGWTNLSWSWVIGSSYVYYCFSALDSVSHLVEDMERPEIDGPKASFIGVGINAVCTIIVVIVLSFCTPDLDEAVTAAPNFPLIAIVGKSIVNRGAAVFLCSVCYVTLIVAGPGCVLITSRIIYSLARDQAIPFHATFRHVDDRFQTPIYASILAAIFPGILCLIYVGNSTALFAITNSTSVFAIISFTMPIILVILCGREKIASRHFDMGRFGIVPYYIASIVGCFYVIVLCFPFYRPVTFANMNYAAAVLGAGIIITVTSWFSYGRNHFRGPLIEIRGVEVSRTLFSQETSGSSLRKRAQGKSIAAFEASRGDVSV